MSGSVLTNTSAMIALQTLRTTNSSLEQVNNQISTGKKVSTASDSAAVFAISKIMESDVSGFEAIETSLQLGGSTLGVAAAAASEVGSLLEEIKGRLISSTADNVDRTSLANEVASLTAQINGVVSAAQFNGLNLLDGSAAGAFDIISSLDRSGTTVTQSSISVSAASTDLSQSAAAAVNAFDTDDAAAAGEGAFTTGTANSNGGTAVADFVTTVTAGNTADIVIQNNALAADNVVTLEIAGQTFSATAVGTSTQDVTAVLADQINAAGITGITAAVTFQAGTTTADDILTITSAAGTDPVTIIGSARDGTTGGLANLGDGTSGSGLAAATATGAAQADLDTIETLIRNTTNVQAAIGTAQSRVDIQQSFMSNLIDSFKSGIGSLVDADLEEASARLQALQVQQQLGVQALSIANQGPQNILALFR